MNLTKGKKAAAAGLGVFFVFMAVCTVVAKGIYRSGLAHVTTQTPYGSSLVHEIKVNGMVRQGKEYGVFTESGLRIASVAVRKGQYFEAGTPLFQVDTDDLQRLIEEKELEIGKSEDQWKDRLLEEQQAGRARQTAEERSREDYENVLREEDGEVEKCRQALEAAGQELELYDQYLSLLSQGSGQVSGGDAAGDSPGGSDTGDTPEQQYSRQEKRRQLLQNVISCSQALEDAERARDMALQSAARAIEDARDSLSSGFSADPAEPDIAFQRKELMRLIRLAENDGWVYSGTAGRVTECRVSVGERTQDGAGILYAADDGEKVIEAVFAKESSRFLTLNAEISLKAILPGGGRISEKAPLNYMEVMEDGDILVELPANDLELVIGQNVELSCRMQTENYMTCIPAVGIHSDEQGGSYVYVAEEREGILGTEWRARKVYVSVLDRTDSVVAVESAEIAAETKIIMNATKELNDGDVVRLVSP